MSIFETKEATDIINNFRDVFKGSSEHFGEMVLLDEYDENGKRKSHCRTVPNFGLTLDQYKNHLAGKKGLGIIPINEHDQCLFGVIDVDLYKGVDFSLYIEAIENFNFPLVPFRSKSNGLHLYLFLKDWAPAKKVIKLLVNFAKLLSIEALVQSKGEKRVEIFPKQKSVKASNDGKKPIGNWINLPYFDAENSTAQRAVYNGKDLELNYALDLIHKRRKTFAEAKDFLDNFHFNDAPPCLQRAYVLNGIVEGERDNFIFNFAVYLFKKDSTIAHQILHDINENIKNPLSQKEVEKTIKSVSGNNYQYKCRESPCVRYCDRLMCRERTFGVGGEGGFFPDIDLGPIDQYKSTESYYVWHVRLPDAENYYKLPFPCERDLLNQTLFIEKCIGEFQNAPPRVKNSEWQKIVITCLKKGTVHTIEKDDDTSTKSQLERVFKMFLTGNALKSDESMFFNGFVIFIEEKKSYAFKASYFEDYLEKRKLKHLLSYYGGKTIMFLKEFGAEATRLKLYNTGINKKKETRLLLVKKEILGDFENMLYDVDFGSEETNF